ncbi:MAG TPA: hypothetical protein VGM09_25225 [Bradyrhizobium sp.]|jgi:hypothetical protein
MPYLTPDAVREPLYAIVPVFNPWRWKSRWKHTERAIKHFIDAGAVVVLVEAAFNRRELAFADSGLDGSPAHCGVLGSDPAFRHRYIGLHTKDELWLKENLINVGVASLPYGWQNVCWLDSDVHFVRPNWVGECIHKLQHYAFLQMFSHARDIGPNYEVLPESYPHANGHGFVHAWKEGLLDKPTEAKIDPATGCKCTCHCHKTASGAVVIRAECCDCNAGYGYGYGYGDGGRSFPGLAWAATRQAWDQVGGLIDFAVWGGSDWHSAHALVDRIDGMMNPNLHTNYQTLVNEWAHRCRVHIRRNVGVMEGSVFHNWHGRKTERGYAVKHSLLAQIGFDPLRHLKRDFQGLYQLHDDGSDAFVKLRDTMRQIAHDRDEDSSDTRLDLEMTQGH